MDLQKVSQDNGIKLAKLKSIADNLNLPYEGLSTEDVTKIVELANSSKPQLTSAQVTELAKQGRLNIEAQGDNLKTEALNPETIELVKAAAHRGKIEALTYQEIREEAFLQQLKAGSSIVKDFNNQTLSELLALKEIRANKGRVVEPLIEHQQAKQFDVQVPWDKILTSNGSIWDELDG